MSSSASRHVAGGQPPAIVLRAINKRFGAVHANRNIDLTVMRGSITGIIGENGAGKSTLVSILYGFYSADSGEIAIDGRPARFANPRDAIACGIGMVHQHFMLVPTMTVLENIMLGREGGALLTHGERAIRERLTQLSRDYGLAVDTDALVGELPVGAQQRVEILKALIGGARILILDEPTGVLTPQEADNLFAILRTLCDDGVTILLITHKLREILAVTDSVAVMRQGEMVASKPTADTNQDELARLMVGRDVQFAVSRDAANPGSEILQVDDLGYRDEQGAQRLSNVSLTLRAGEILGIAGVAGNGQSELLDVLAGITPMQQGRVRIVGREVSAVEPAEPMGLRELGVAHIPEDRHRRGLVLPFAAYESSILGYHHAPFTGQGLLLALSDIRERCASLMQRYDVRPPVSALQSAGFSGGNQQKIVVARELAAKPRLLLVGQPTRGVDIGAIEFIHRELIAIRDAGCAILLVSVELDEILAVADRIMVMNAGQIVGEVTPDQADARTIGLMMAGIPQAAGR